jgi:competence protein ComEA
MKEWMIIVVVLTLIAVIVLFPRKEVYSYVSHEKVELDSFEIEIRGEVVFPGVYTFFEPMRLDEIIKFTYGFTTDANMSELDLSHIFNQDSYIFIPSHKVEETHIIKININNANFQTLLEIPGMTEDRAASLIVYRQEHGLFASIDELIHVKNIGPVTLEKIRPYITLG